MRRCGRSHFGATVPEVDAIRAGFPTAQAWFFLKSGRVYLQSTYTNMLSCIAAPSGRTAERSREKP